MENVNNTNFKTAYKDELRDALMRESQGRLKPEVVDKVANAYVTSLELTGGFEDTKRMHKDPTTIATDMLVGMRPEMFLTE